jgi:hypothetical protein
MEKKEASSSDYSPSDNGSTGSNNSGSKTFGLDARNTNNIDPRTIKSFAIKVDGKDFDIFFENTIIPDEFIEKAQTYSPLLIDHIGKGSKGAIKTRRRGIASSRAKTAKSRSSLKLIKQIKQDLREEGEPVVYTWMLVSELKKNKYHYYLLSNKVKSRQEIGTTHASIEKRYTEQMGHLPHRIYLTGEFCITPTTITYNFISGTYMKDKMTELERKSLAETEDTIEDKYTKPIEDLFSEMLQKYFDKFRIVKGHNTTSFILTNNPNITPKELAFLQELFGEKWNEYVIPGKKTMARFFGIQPIVRTKEQKEAEEERKRIALEKMMNRMKPVAKTEANP